MRKTILKKIVGIYLIRFENCHLEIFSLPAAIENSRQFFPLQTDILQKIIVGCSFFKWSGLYPRGLFTGIEGALRNKLFFSIHLEAGAYIRGKNL